MSSERGAPAAREDAGLGVVLAIGVGQVIAWGSLYYTMTVLGRPMAASFGVGDPIVFAAFSGALLASGAAAPLAGRLLDRRGGRVALALGALIGAAGLALLAVAPNLLVYFAGWAVCGVAMSFALYDPAFATLAQITPRTFRRAVTAVTLLGGFASTVFWPLTQWLFELYGWRVTLAVFALVHLVVSLPLHWWALPAHRREPERPADAPEATPAAAAPAAPRALPGVAALSLAFALGQFITAAIGVHVINLLTTGGLSVADAVWIGALIGPMQVLGRIVEFALDGRVRARSVGLISLGLTLASMVVLAFTRDAFVLAIVFVVLYGWANGTMTIVRGTVPAELYGRDAYGALLGRLGRAQFIAKAVAPFAFSTVLASGAGTPVAAGLLGLTAALSLLAYLVALRR